MTVSSDLAEFVGGATRVSAAPELKILRDALLDRYADSVQAIMIYGSCLRSGDYLDGLVDLYLVVDAYSNAYGRHAMAFSNWLLPPNVFYLERPHAGTVVRSKYAVLSLHDLQRGTSRRWFHSYLWGRFTQPTGLLYVRDDAAARAVTNALGRAAVTFAQRVLPRIAEEFETATLWDQGLALSYGAELRAEKSGRSRQIYDSYRDYYETLTQLTLPCLPYRIERVERDQVRLFRAQIPAHTRLASRITWKLRQIQGKLLSLLRLIKALFTFRGGIDYIAWKLERHSGVEIQIPPELRRRPLIHCWGFMWRLYRRGIFR